MLSRLGIVAAPVLALSIAGAGAAYAATYSLDETPTVVVIHPDSLDALAELLAAVPSGVETVTVSNFPTATVGTVSLADSEAGALAVLVVASVLTSGSLAYLVGVKAGS